MYKILVLKNRVAVPVEDDFAKAVDYFKRRGINVSFDFTDINIPVSVKYYKVSPDGKRYYGIEDSVKDACDKFVPKGQYHAVCFTWNTADVTQPTGGDLTSWTNWSPLTWGKADTEFIQLITNDYNDKVDWIYKSITHEIMHTFCKRLGRRGLNVIDEMDETIMKDGTRIPYHLNWDPEQPDGNYAHTFENLKPHMDKIYEMYFFEREKRSVVYKRGQTSDGVKELQNKLKTLGYLRIPQTTRYFGPLTEDAVRRFQKIFNLTVDGVAGFETLSKIDEAVKKNSSLGNKPNLGLLPKVQRRAEMLINIMEVLGKPIRITEGLRTMERQTELYSQGRTTPGRIVTNARAGDSFHNYGVAFDVVFVKTGYSGDWDLLGKIGKALGLEWGGDFEGLVDKPHFEMKLGKTIQDFKNNKVDYTQYN